MVSFQELDAAAKELFRARFFDVFKFDASEKNWACLICANPEKATGLMKDGQPVIEGQLKEKKGKWKIFKRWKTRHFTLSGANITYSKKDVSIHIFSA